jgi:hypothetical protein
VANAPTRRPPNYPATRRHQRGPRVARSSREIREGLVVAAQQLREAGHNDSAEVVDEVLAGGWKQVIDVSGTTNLALTMSQRLKDDLKAASGKFSASLSTTAEGGFRAVLEGTWVPPQVIQTRYGSQDERTVLNVRVDKELVDRVRPLLPRLSEQVGYRVTASNIAISWLAEEFGVDRFGPGPGGTAE